MTFYVRILLSKTQSPFLALFTGIPPSTSTRRSTTMRGTRSSSFGTRRRVSVLIYGSGVAMMGVSAGAGLAAGVIVRDLAHARNTPGYETIIKGLVLSIPWLIHIDNYPFHEFASREKASKIQCSEAPVVPAPRMKLFSDILDAQDPTDPLLNVGLYSCGGASGVAQDRISHRRDGSAKGRRAPICQTARGRRVSLQSGASHIDPKELFLTSCV